MVGFILDEAPQDVQDWVRNYEWPAQEVKMEQGQCFTNSFGKNFYVLENSPSGQDLVKVKEILPYGVAIRYIHKAILLI